MANDEPEARKIAAQHGGTECTIEQQPDYNPETEADVEYRQLKETDLRNPWIKLAKCVLLGPFTGDPSHFHFNVVCRDVLNG